MTGGEAGGAAGRDPAAIAGAAGEPRQEAAGEAANEGAIGAACDCVVEALIVNQRGLHARASAQFVRCAERFDADVTVTKDGQTVGGTSSMGLMMLAAGIGSRVTVRAEGPEADAALAELRALIESGFGEES
jgi:phosphocarrier protein